MTSNSGTGLNPLTPYDRDKARIWWKKGLAAFDPDNIQALYCKKFTITNKSKIGTGGSCFAQHISRHMRENGYNIYDCERAPFGMGIDSMLKYGYNIYSCRYGNIYHVRQLNQLLKDAIDKKIFPELVWKYKGAFYDALRPTVEPNGLESIDAVLHNRSLHLECVKKMFQNIDVYIFTLGLTEAWIDMDTHRVLPVFPGVYDTFSFRHYFENFSVHSIYDDFVQFYQIIKKLNPKIKFILTVSPVPLVATATGEHVLTATTASKSILRTVAHMLYSNFEDIDYFPSYEIIISPWSRGRFFQDDLRGVTPEGVSAVMRVFFDQHKPLKNDADEPTDDNAICDEELLEAFGNV